MFQGFDSLLGSLQFCAAPAVNFGMTVREGHAAGAAMVTGGKINDLIGNHVDGKFAVVDTVISLVHKDQRVANGNAGDLAFLAKGTEAIVPWQRTVPHPDAPRYSTHQGVGGTAPLH